jgi:hypothetical protein
MSDQLSSTARVRLESRPLWRLRAARSLTRWVVYGTALIGIAATARFTIAPPNPRIRAASRVPHTDRVAEGFALLFARRYLTWESTRPALHAKSLAPYLSSSVDPDAGMRIPARGSQRVAWAEIVQTRSLGPAEHVYTVEAQTDAGAVLYVAIDVVRDADRRFALGRYPAFVAGPAIRPAGSLEGEGLGSVSDPAMIAVAERALANYLNGSRQNLDADLAPGAEVASPNVNLEIDSFQALRAEAGRRAVLATVIAHDRAGASYTLTYELDLVRNAGRWELAAIGTDPSIRDAGDG